MITITITLASDFQWQLLCLQCQLQLQLLLSIIITLTELPTITFLPYFVRFLKENTAVCFYLIKYVFLKFHFFFFFFLLESESSEIYTHYLCYEKLVRVFESKMFKNKAKIAPESI